MTGRRSFRIRIAALSALVTGGVLGGLGLFLWIHVVASGGDRIDREIARLAERHLDHARLPPHGEPAGPLPDAFLGEEFRRVEVWLRDAGGETIHRSPGWPGNLNDADLPWDPARPDRDARPVEFRTIERGDRSWRIGTVAEDGVRVDVALDLAPHRAAIDHVHRILAGAIALALTVAAAGGWWMAGRAIRPIADVTRLAESLGADDLARRIPETATDREFARLIEVLNGMFARLERSFEQAARFSADASHELRTPLTIMQGEVEAALSRVEPGGDAERALTIQLEEIHRLKALVDRLLLLARADRGCLVARAVTFDLSELVRDSIDDASAVATADRIEFDVHLAAGVLVAGDPGLLERAVRNMLDNAVRHNRPDGRVEVEVANARGTARVRVANTGPSIAPADRDRIFDRFFRADPSRSRRIDGVGLGLALAREIARAHRGDLVLEPQGVQGVNVFTLILPDVPVAPDGAEAIHASAR